MCLCVAVSHSLLLLVDVLLAGANVCRWWLLLVVAVPLVAVMRVVAVVVAAIGFQRCCDDVSFPDACSTTPRRPDAQEIPAHDSLPWGQSAMKTQSRQALRVAGCSSWRLPRSWLGVTGFFKRPADCHTASPKPPEPGSSP